MTRRTRRTAPLLVALVAVTSVALSCSDGSGSSSTTTAVRRSTTSGAAAPTGDAAKGDLTKGECLEPLRPGQTSAVLLPLRVSCDQPHGGEIVAVYQLSAPAGAAYPAMTDNVVGADDLSAKCGGDGRNEGDFDRFVGTSRLQVPADVAKSTGVNDAWLVSGIQAAVYVPNPSQWAAGKRWYACAAVLANSSKVPASYTGSLAGARQADGGQPARFAWCKLQPDAQDDRRYDVVPCDQSHNYEQVSSFSYGDSKMSFPGQKGEDDTARTVCSKLNSSATNGKSDDLPSGFDVSWSFPVEADWNSGSRIGRCFVVTTTGNSTGTVETGTAKAS